MTWLPSADDYFPAEPSQDSDQDASSTTAVAVEQEAMSSEEAERLTMRISLKLGTLADTYESVMPLIREAIDRKAHEALGYPSIGAYAADRFGDSLTRLGLDMRRDVVRELTAAGMSTRAIAPIVGVSQKTVVKDTQVIPEVSPAERLDSALTELDSIIHTSEPVAKVTGLDGKGYVRPRRPQPKPEPEPMTAKEKAAATRAQRKAEKEQAAYQAKMVTALNGVRSAHRRLLAPIAATDDFAEIAETLDTLEQWKAENGAAWAALHDDQHGYIHSQLAAYEKLSALVSDVRRAAGVGLFE